MWHAFDLLQKRLQFFNKFLIFDDFSHLIVVLTLFLLIIKMADKGWKL
jgi:hypothetical protein